MSPAGSLLDLPVWKWAAIVEHWAWAHVEEDKHAELQAELSRTIEWTWIAGYGADEVLTALPPVRWQENKPGESLLSRHRKKDKKGA